MDGIGDSGVQNGCVGESGMVRYYGWKDPFKKQMHHQYFLDRNTVKLPIPVAIDSTKNNGTLHTSHRLAVQFRKGNKSAPTAATPNPEKGRCTRRIVKLCSFAIKRKCIPKSKRRVGVLAAPTMK